MTMQPWSVSAGRWLEGLDRPDSELFARLAGACGGTALLSAARLSDFRRVLRRFVELFGHERPVGVVRVPGRLNVLGMHVDHRAGYVNPVALAQEVVLVFSPNDDDLVDVVNLDASYGRRAFRVSDNRPVERLRDTDAWLDWTQQLVAGRSHGGTAADWTHKLAAPAVYLAHFAFPDHPVKGFTGVISGSIPPRVGLSSSSAVVVAMMTAMLAANGLSAGPGELIEHCGIAEWYVGTRGGFGDHGAIVGARAGRLLHIRTVPELHIGDLVPFPDDLRLLVFHSGFDADKTGAAGNTFNERTATYEVGEMLAARFLCRRHPVMWREFAEARRSLKNPKPMHLGDIAERLGSAEIYELLDSIPERADRKSLRTLLPERKETLERQFATHREPQEGYGLRGVLLYGIAECARSARGPELLRKGDIRGFGRLMNISHDGDRIGGSPKGTAQAAVAHDTVLEISEQPGVYACSTLEIDAMVDIALAAGALGAQITGAGLGGSMMALVDVKLEEAVVKAMTDRYFEPRGIEPNHLSATPSPGARLV